MGIESVHLTCNHYLTLIGHLERRTGGRIIASIIASSVRMVHSCCVVGCTNRYGKEKDLSFHQIPKVHFLRVRIKVSLEVPVVVGVQTCGTEYFH